MEVNRRGASICRSGTNDAFPGNSQESIRIPGKMQSTWARTRSCAVRMERVPRRLEKGIVRQTCVKMCPVTSTLTNLINRRMVISIWPDSCNGINFIAVESDKLADVLMPCLHVNGDIPLHLSMKSPALVFSSTVAQPNDLAFFPAIPPATGVTRIKHRRHSFNEDSVVPILKCLIHCPRGIEAFRWAPVNIEFCCLLLF